MGGTVEAGSGAGKWTEPPLPGQVPGPLGWSLGHNCFEDPFLWQQRDMVLTSPEIFKREVLFL